MTDLSNIELLTPTAPSRVSPVRLIGAVLAALALVAGFAALVASGNNSSSQTLNNQNAPDTTMPASECGPLAPGMTVLGYGFNSITYEVLRQVASCKAGKTHTTAGIPSVNGSPTNYQIPDWVDMRPMDAYFSSYSSTTITSGYSATKSSGFKISLDGIPIVAALAGGASAGVQHDSEVTDNGLQQITNAEKNLALYQLGADLATISTVLSPEFETALEEVSRSDDLNEWKTKLFEVYGTHFVSALSVGGMAQYSVSYQESTETKGSSGTQSMSLSLGAAFTGANGKLGADGANSKLTESGYQSVKGSMACVGGVVTNCEVGSWSDWINSVYAYPAAIPSTTLPISVVPMSSIVPDALKDMVQKQVQAYLTQELNKCPVDKHFLTGGGTCSSIEAGVCDPESRGPDGTPGKCICAAGKTGNACDVDLVPLTLSEKGKPPLRGEVTIQGTGSTGGIISEKFPVCTLDKGVDEYNTRAWSVQQGPTEGAHGLGQKKFLSAFGSCLSNEIILPPGVCATTYMLHGLSWGAYDSENGWAKTTVCTKAQGCEVVGHQCGGDQGSILKGAFCAYQLRVQSDWSCGGYQSEYWI